MTLRLLAVHAHPDDESSKGAATYAHYARRGVRVLVVSCTGGEAGDILNPGLAPAARVRAERDMAGHRRTEMAEAQRILGIEHRWLGYRDSGLPGEGEGVRADSFAGIPVEISGRALVRVVREFRPHVLVSYDENGGYPHPDHIRAHEIAVWANAVAADAAALLGSGAPWATPKHYYDRIFSLDRTRAVSDGLHAADPADGRIAQLDEMLAWRELRDAAGGRPATTRVPCAAEFDIRDAALRAHASQVAPDDPWFFWPNDVQRRVWPTEDFELVSSTVPTSVPETDLFAGIVDDRLPEDAP
ncbi:mycothiol conjugate amidase Mca [Galbitalea sp. SE-J8]|uniref:mycothiol conjugate amidase Mca n=1 Tax=Galbitalea sp. SE-J8 TaxID=3054952 RepID=UPI00259C8F31|nr:mycothiol conjugate amidase Mca [Galbitalea sp. SE-J8]MDM4763397.1 mycothiol conjugate amidase Mca [Galbitalea sp. SE-J8]